VCVIPVTVNDTDRYHQAVPTDVPVRSRLLAATARLIYRDGITATGVEGIAAAAGVAKMSLYRHFPGGKDELVAAALARRRQDVVGRLVEDARRLAGGDHPDGRPDPVATVLAVFDVVDAQTRDPHWRGCPFLNAAAELPPEHPGRAVVLAHRRDLHDRFTRLLQEAAVGDPAGLAGTLLLLLDGALAGGALTPDQRPALLAREVAATLLTGVPWSAPARGAGTIVG
jgi:AcrR family transcriptional regulator